MVYLVILLIVLATIYLCGAVFVIVAGAMKLTDDSHLVREQGREQLRRAPVWPIDEFQRVKAERIESKRLAHIEQSEQILRQLDQVEKLQRRNLATWNKAAQSQDRLRDLTKSDGDGPGAVQK